MVAHPLRDGGTEKTCFPFATSQDCLREDLSGGLLLEETRDASRIGPFDVLLVAVFPERDDHLGGGIGGEDLPRRLQAVEHRHGNVHEDDIGAEGQRHVHSLAARPRFADHGELAVGFQQRGQALADDGVVFREEDGDLFGEAHVLFFLG